MNVTRVEHKPLRFLTCPMRLAGGEKCLYTATAEGATAIHQEYEKQGGGEVMVLRQFYRCASSRRHEFLIEWIEEIPAAGPTPEEIHAMKEAS